MMQPSRKLNTFSPASQIQWGIIQDGNVVLDANVFRTKMCPQFSAKGTCQYGSICQFAHSRAELRRRPEEPQPVPYVPAGSCQWFYLTNWCAFGADCQKTHFAYPSPMVCMPVSLPRKGPSVDPLEKTWRRSEKAPEAAPPVDRTQRPWRREESPKKSPERDRPQPPTSVAQISPSAAGGDDALLAAEAATVPFHITMEELREAEAESDELFAALGADVAKLLEGE